MKPNFLWKYLLPLSLGSSLYALCRPTTLLYERIFYLFIGTSWIPLKRQLNYSCRGIFFDEFSYKLIVYSLPNALWHISLCYLLSFGIKSLWEANGVAWRYRLVLFFVAALVPDALQLLELIPGTFDVLDIILAFLASAFVWFFNGL